jgi:sec-independent protein translocase protein TatB
MFGMGFMEIFLVLIVAIMALGPEKLPGAAVDIARFFKKMKSGIDDAKSTLDNELNISDMKKEAAEFKASVGNVKSLVDVDLDDLSNIMDEDAPSSKQVVSKENIQKPADEFKAKKVIKNEKQADEFKVVKAPKKEKISMSKEEEV